MTPVAKHVAPSLLIAIPFYRNEHLVAGITHSLVACAVELRELGARVILFDDAPDYAPLGAALSEAVEAIGGAVSVAVRRNAGNIGWLKTCNIALQEAKEQGADALLLNSDTVLFPGAISEMLAVAALDPMIGFVNPRSNNATLASFPIGERFVQMPPNEAHALWRAGSRTLPRLTYTPTAVGFAMLIRHRILAEFGVFDEAYGRGYNEENDLVMRASRCGYRSVIANQAFVWHRGEQSFGAEADSKHQIEAANRAILVGRYPEYDDLIKAWQDSVEYRAEQLLSALSPDRNGRLRLAFDFSNFGRFHSGTQMAGLQLLKSVAGWRDRFEVCVLCAEDVFEFHGLQGLGFERRDPNDPELFAAIFRVGQPFDWDAMVRLGLKAAVLGVFMLDTISIDSSHLSNSPLYNLWQLTISQSDFIVYNSAFTERQFRSRFANVDRRRHKVSPHSLDLADYAPRTTDNSAASGPVQALPEGYALVIGNHYPHKGVGEAANRLARSYPRMQVVAIGVTSEPSKLSGAPTGERGSVAPQDDRLLDLPNLVGFPSGELSVADIEALQRKAKVIIMPSHYEGFGFPLLSALAMRKPFLARSIPALQELNTRIGYNPNVHFFDATEDLVRLMGNPPAWTDAGLPAAVTGDNARAARDIRDLLDAAIADASYGLIHERFRELHTIYGVPSKNAGSPPPDNNSDSAAYRLGKSVERMTRRLFHVPAFYGAVQLVYRAGRAIGINK